MIRSKLQWIHWKFSPDLQTDALWIVFKETLNTSQQALVPCNTVGSCDVSNRGLRDGAVRMRLSPFDPRQNGGANMAVVGQPQDARDALPVRHYVDTLSRRVAHLDTHIGTEAACLIDLSPAVTGHTIAGTTRACNKWYSIKTQAY